MQQGGVLQCPRHCQLPGVRRAQSQGVERLDDMRAGGGGLGDFLCPGTALGREKAREIGDGVGDVDDDLAV